MAGRLLLVDFENVQDVELARLDETWRVIIFVGASQKSVPIGLVTAAQGLGSRVEWQRLDASGRNALDFFIAYQLGRELGADPQLDCTILSKDKGFDPLLRQLTQRGFKCRRVDGLSDGAAPAPPKGKSKAKTKSEPMPLPPTQTQCERVIEILKKSDKKNRPRKRKTLSQFISGVFQKKIDAHAVKAIIDHLLAEKFIVETNGVISYEF